jgi:outer membrane cobalamin receptor
MKIKALQRIFVLLVALMTALPAMAQGFLSGRVLDGADNTPLAGTLITNTTTGDVAISANDGTFRIRRGAGPQALTVTFLGYQNLEVAVEATRSNLGDISLEADAISVADVVVMAGIVTKDRQTPVAISNVTRPQIEMRLSNQEFPEILKSTPSVYVTKQGGGYGESRINMRGFDSNNIGVLINGVPINDMNNGRVFWSNWGSLSDVTSFVQVQRGLGASKLGLSSVGGTMNMVTRSTDAEKGGSVYYGIGNDGFQKLNFSLSTGLTDKGWAFSIAGGRQSGNGYVQGTNFEVWNYFVNLSKVLAGGRHRLSLTAFGSPQWHNNRGNMYTIEDYRTSKDGRRMNRSWGFIDGKPVGTAYGYNTYHKPQVSLVHTWQINSKSMLSTSIYVSPSTGNGRVTAGSKSNWVSVNGSNSGTGQYYDDTAVTPEGHIDYNWVFEQNKNSVNGSQAILGKSLNSHNWYGILSTYTNQITDDIKITAGFDGRYFKSFHQNIVDNLLGGEYYLDNSSTGLDYRPKDTPLHEGDVYGYDETAEVLWAGLFAQAEYVKNDFSAFLSSSVTSHNYRWANYGQASSREDGRRISDWTGYAPWSVKGGASYKVGRNHSFFANGGYFTRAPFRSDAFIGYTVSPNPDAKYERVTTAEAGYTFANNVLNLTFNGYYTLWLDKTMKKTIQGEVYYLKGLNARHMGLELEATYRPSTRLTIKAMGSLGDWIWRDNVNFTAYTDQQEVIGSFDAFIAGVHVGNSAQMTAALNVEWEPLNNLRVGGYYNWYGKNFAEYDPTNRTQIQDQVDSWQMPDYSTIDLSLSYNFKLSDNVRGTFFGNINNLFDTWYIADARDGEAHDARSAFVYYGFGRTWTAGLKFNF